MRGNTRVFNEHIAFLRQRQAAGQTFNYLEIGAAAGGTLRMAVNLLLNSEQPWKVVGVDVPNGWCLDIPMINQRFADAKTDSQRPLFFEYPHGTVEVMICDGGVQKDFPIDMCLWDFVFVDGCHGKACAIADFIKVESQVRPGGRVCFHDASANCQGRDRKQHCGGRQGIRVRPALQELGLLDDRRPGWKRVGETFAGRGIVIFEKVL